MESKESLSSDETSEIESQQNTSPGEEAEVADVAEEDRESDVDLKDVDVSSEYSNISMQENEETGHPLGDNEISQMGAMSPKRKADGDVSKTEQELQNLCSNMFMKMEEYLKGEIASSVEDYALLERMNKSTTYKYQNMLQIASAVGQKMHEINHKFSDLRPYLQQIENIEENVLALEQAAYKLDGYAKRLEERFKRLEKR